MMFKTVVKTPFVRIGAAEKVGFSGGYFPVRLRAVALVFSVLALSLGGKAYAKPAGAVGKDFIYIVEPGDTLIGIAQTYLTSWEQWRSLQAENQIKDPFHLPVGGVVRIPLRWIPEDPDRARVVQVSMGGLQKGGKAVTDGAFSEGDVLETGPAGWAILELGDGSRLSLSPNSRVQLANLRRFRNTGLTDSVIHIDKGAVEQTVAPRGNGVGRFEIRTRYVTTGVRGTRYRVETDGKGMRGEVLEGTVDFGAPAATATLSPGLGVAATPDGTLLSPKKLLAAPSAAAIKVTQLPGGFAVAFDPVGGAARYRIDIRPERAGSQQWRSLVVDQPQVVIGDLASGAYTVGLRAIDEQGFEGFDSTVAVNVVAPHNWEEFLPRP
ncbi:FecR domain-containing protein [Ralstonia sp. 25C]|uniref:FecR family protein n=1 Tax=Ralstonia sp. 25C TaxID=3447363 RepID=UPI003F757090